MDQRLEVFMSLAQLHDEIMMQCCSEAISQSRQMTIGPGAFLKQAL